MIGIGGMWLASLAVAGVVGAGVASAPAAARDLAALGQLAEGRAVTSNEIQQELIGRVLYRLEPAVIARNGTPGRRAHYFVMRADGSFLYKCEFYVDRARAWVLCSGNARGSLKGGFTNGVWTVQGDRLCLTATTVTGATCHTVRERSGAIAMTYQSGRRSVVMPGTWTVLTEKRPECAGSLKSGDC